MSLDGFWAVIDAQLTELKSAKSADDVIRILAHDRDPYYAVLGDTECHGPSRGADSGFFGGSGGDGQVIDSLAEAGWHVVWSEASYYWCCLAPDGASSITYVEGDVYRGNTKAAQ